jgi:hypothetical protein
VFLLEDNYDNNEEEGESKLDVENKAIDEEARTCMFKAHIVFTELS